MNDYLQPKETLFGFTLPNSEMLKPLLIAGTLHCTCEHVYKLCKEQVLESINIAPLDIRASWRTPRAQLVDFIKDRTTGPLDANFSATEAPHNLVLPAGDIYNPKHIAEFLQCTDAHVCNLIEARELLATDLSRQGRKCYRITRSGLIQFIISRMEGAY